MRTEQNLGLGILLAAVTSASPAMASLVDPGFETSTNPLLTAAQTLSNFNTSQGLWGQENSIVTPTINGIVPFAGSKMLKMSQTGAVTTQAFQAFALTPSATPIAYSAGAHFTSDLPNAVAGVYVSYFTAPTFSVGPLQQSVATLSSTVGQWQLISFNGTIPANTSWVLFQVAFTNASLVGQNGQIGSGYVDDTFIIVPAPSGAALLATAGLTLARRRRGTI